MILLHSGKQGAEVGRKRGDCLFSLKSCAGFGFVHLNKVNETLPLALVFFFFSTNNTSFKPCAGFGFVRVTQTRLHAFFALALFLFKKIKPRLPPAGFRFVYSNDKLCYNRYWP